MSFAADLHIHSRFSRATSRNCDAPHLDLWARRKGIGLVGTGDFTHPAWRQELHEMLHPVEEGFYRLKDEHILPCEVHPSNAPRFVISGEISTIYKRGGKTRKVHHLILLPSLEAAEICSHRLEAIGNLHSDGRPILGLDSRDLLEIILESCPEAIYIPAHIWTPHFSLFGAFSDFDTLEECYADLSPYVHAMETGLSSDPLMNRRLSILDKYTLVSNSDAHSPAKLGRESNLLSCSLSYPSLKHAIETGDGFDGTIEFYPEEGKYHLDGHRKCHCCMEPAQTAEQNGICPVCGHKLTVGVLHRVEALADRDVPIPLPKPFESLIPLPELLSDCLNVSSVSKKVEAAYHTLLGKLGSELDILRSLPLDSIEKTAGPIVCEAVRRLRKGEVFRKAGYDGEYGIIRVFEPGETERLSGQTSLINLSELPVYTGYQTQGVKKKKTAIAAPKESVMQHSSALNAEQLQAVQSTSSCTAIIAGPGTGKTKTLVSRIAYLLDTLGVSPSEITAVTFTRQAASEMMDRLTKQLGKKAVHGLNIGTFHSICMKLLDRKPIVSRQQAQELISNLLIEHDERMSPGECLRLLTLYKNHLCQRTDATAELPAWLADAYNQRLSILGLRDLDDLLLHALQLPSTQSKQFQHLLVDEFQDINTVQHALIEHWSKQSKSLFVIGDPDQAIYGFRGAQADCFDRFLSVHPAANLIYLRQNYRSTPQIIEAAHCSRRNNAGNERNLVANRKNGVPVRLLEATDSFSESYWIAKEITKMVGGVDMLEAQRLHADQAASCSFSEIAVLCRTNHQLEQIESALIHNNIPCVISGHDDFLSDRTVQGMLGFFNSLVDHSDSASLQAALSELWRIPSPLIQPAAVVWAASDNLNTQELKKALSDFPLLLPWIEAVEVLSAHLSSDKPRKQLEKLASLCKVDSNAVRKLFNTSVFYNSLSSMLNSLRMDDSTDICRISGKGYTSGAVRLMTLHGAKGLEFPVVFLSGLTEGVFPIESARKDTDMEEERRLFFVGITRAKEELILTCGGKPSQFVKELGSTVVHEEMISRNKAPKMEQLTLFDL